MVNMNVMYLDITSTNQIMMITRRTMLVKMDKPEFI